jgi:hypothetical protein
MALGNAPRQVRFGSKLKRTQCEQMSSSLRPKADLAQCSRQFAFVPKAAAWTPKVRASSRQDSQAALFDQLISAN